MKHLICVTLLCAAFVAPLTSRADNGRCVPGTLDLESISPPSWTVPGDYNLWTTNCGHYVFNQIDQPADASWFVPSTGTFINYGLATNTITELESDNGNKTVAAQINGWSIVDSGLHWLFGAAIQTVNSPEGDALITMVGTESQVNSRNSENTAPKVGLDTVLFTAQGSDNSDIGSDKYNLNSRAHYISASAPQKGEHNGWENGIYVSEHGLGTSVNRDFKTMINIEQVPDSVCLATFTRKNGKTGCLRYNIEEDRMEVVGDIHNNSEIKVFQTFEN